MSYEQKYSTDGVVNWELQPTATHYNAENDFLHEAFLRVEKDGKVSVLNHLTDEQWIETYDAEYGASLLKEDFIVAKEVK